MHEDWVVTEPLLEVDILMNKCKEPLVGFSATDCNTELTLSCVGVKFFVVRLLKVAETALTISSIDLMSL